MTNTNNKEKFVQIRSVQTRCWENGESGPVTILLHGIGGSVEMWQDNIESLSEQNKVYAFDMVGFGQTGKPDAAYTLSFQADFLHSFMNALEIESANLVGMSLGGGVALDFSLRYPHRMEKLVLVDSVGLGKEAHILFRLPTLPLVGEWLTRPNRERMRALLEECFYDTGSVSEEMVDLFYELSTQPGAQNAYLSTLRSLGSINGLRQMVLDSILRGLNRLEAATLIIWGRQDKILPLEQAQRADKRLPNSELKIIDQCGHLPAMEKPEQFNRIVTDFLNQEGG